MEIRETSAVIRLPFERPLFTPAFKPNLAATILAASGEEIDASALFAVRVVDKPALAAHIRHALQTAAQITLRELVESRPLEHGLAEIIAYLEIASGGFTITVDETNEEILTWTVATDDGAPLHKSARLPRVIFMR
jgi:hypothetical protein